MMIDKIKRAIELVRKTGDKMILFEEGDDDGVVIMSIEEYERLASFSGELKDAEDADNKDIGDLTEEELIDRVNRSIAEWQSLNQGEAGGLIDPFPEDEEENEEPEEDNFYYYTEDGFAPATEEDEDVSGQGSDKRSEEEKEKDDEKDDDHEQKNNKSKKGGWEIPVNIKKDAEDVEEE